MLPRIFFLILFLSGLCASSGILKLQAQAPGCPNVNAGADRNLDCLTNCTTLNATVFQSGATNDYTVASIPYAPPYPFTGGTQIFINIDDRWTNVITLPFNFCFYGNMYNQLIIGTNGVVSFDLSRANNFCEWSFSAPIPTPGPPPAGIYNNSINGAFHDIDPAVSTFIPTFPFVGYPANINYAVLGAAPCRTFVINWGTVPQYSCNNLQSTQQIVLYETTNAIEVYIANKPTCNAWNSGNAVIGLQNIDGTIGITPPGRNTGPWTTSNEAWRFMPSGAPNWTFTWYDAAMNAIGNSLSLNVCPTGTSTYVAEAVYTACDGSVVVVQDQVTINIAGGFTSSFTKTDESCAGCDGTVTVSASGGTPPFSYNIGSGSQPSPVFNGLCSGTYTLSVQDAANCSGTLNVIIDASSTISATSSSTAETCAGLGDGTISLSATGGVSPYTYSMSGGATNNNGTFTSLAANTYSFTVADATGCSTTGAVTVQAGSVLNVSATGVNATCGCDGNISITASGGSGTGYEYSIDGGMNFQSSPGFANICQGAYQATARDVAGCTGTASVQINSSSAIAITGTIPTLPGCAGRCDATLTIQATSASAYSIDNGITFQPGNVFSNLCSGVYDLAVSDGGSCVEFGTAFIDEPQAITLALLANDVLCNGACDGRIAVIPAAGTPPFQFSSDNGLTFQAGNEFTGLCAGTYTLLAADVTNCTATATAAIAEPVAVDIAISVTDAACNDCNAEAVISASGGVPPYAYSVNGGAQGTANVLPGLCPGDYTLAVYDGNNCAVNSAFSAGEQLPITVSAGTDDSLRVGESVTLNPVISDNALVNTILWSPATALNCTDCANPVAAPLETIVYTLNVTDVFGCAYADDVRITVYSEALINIPNAFSPNGDNLNDVFFITGKEIAFLNLMIFDRWGEKVFQSTDMQTGWDGTFRGKLLDAGVYVYYAEARFLSGKKEIFRGSITLLR